MDESAIGAERRGMTRLVGGSWPARAGELREMQAALRSWLAPLCLDPVTVDRLVMAAHEAACNAVQHAYPPAIGNNGARGRVDLTLHTERTSVCVEITDHGNWREPAIQPIGRGLGIALMHRLVASVLIHKDGRGTRVLLRHPIADSSSSLRSIHFRAGTTT
jgi:anti-sigma regulatory factor (Ser/Thr protein kinase)